MDAARTMYHELSPETAEFIDFMQDNELFDVESRPGKMSGGYMTSLPSYKAPFIFANWNNTSGDVDVLTHECGHAFEGYVAERDPNVPADLECPGMESAEIHSMAMEFLTAPWHHLLFGKDTEKYALLHAEDSFVFLAYGCAVDEFQHIMYQNPDLTPDQRNAEWLKLEKKYRPWIDFDNLPFYGRGAGWQRQLHIYECPFYYIDYCLSTMAALQFFLLSLDDHKDAWERYLKLVRRAGLASYTELMQTAGLKVPFEEGSVKGIAQQMTRWLEEHQVFSGLLDGDAPLAGHGLVRLQDLVLAFFVDAVGPAVPRLHADEALGILLPQHAVVKGLVGVHGDLVAVALVGEGHGELHTVSRRMVLSAPSLRVRVIFSGAAGCSPLAFSEQVRTGCQNPHSPAWRP